MQSECILIELGLSGYYATLMGANIGVFDRKIGEAVPREGDEFVFPDPSNKETGHRRVHIHNIAECLNQCMRDENS